MNAKLWGCVILGVLVAHLSVLFIIDHYREGKRPRPVSVEPNFTGSTATFTNERGEKVKVEHEFTVNTELASRQVLEKLPSPPKTEGGIEPEKSAAPASAR